MSNLTVTKEYIDGFVKANNTFLYQLVYDPLKRELVPLHPYPAGLISDEMHYAGPVMEAEKAYQIALGNLDINTGKQIANFDPDTFTPKYKKNPTNVKTKDLLHMKSIWDPGYRTMPKIGLNRQQLSVIDRPCNKNTQVTVNYNIPKKSPVKRLRCAEEEEKMSLEEKQELLKSYVGALSPKKKRQKVELKENFDQNNPESDVSILVALAEPESSYIEDNLSTCEATKENSPTGANVEMKISPLKSPRNKFAVKSKLNKNIFDMNATVPTPNVKSRFFTQSKPLQKTNFFDLLGDDKAEQSAPSLPPYTNEEDDEMDSKDFSHLSFGLDSVLHRATIEALSQEDENCDSKKNSPYGSFRSRLNMFKSGFGKNTLNSSTKSREQFKPVKQKQTKLDQFDSKKKTQKKPIPNTNFFDDKAESDVNVEKQAPSLPADTYEEDDQMEFKSFLTFSHSPDTKPSLPSLSLFTSSDCDSVVSSEPNENIVVTVESLPVSTSEKVEGANMTSFEDTSNFMHSQKMETHISNSSANKSGSILKLFRKAESKTKDRSICINSDKEKNADKLMGSSDFDDISNKVSTQQSGRSPISQSSSKPGPCRSVGLNKSKKLSASVTKDKKQPKLTESLSIYFLNKKVNKLPPTESTLHNAKLDFTPEASSGKTKSTSLIQRKLSLH